MLRSRSITLRALFAFVRSVSFVCAVTSGILLVSLYPPWNVSELAWLALIPLCWVSWREKPAAAFRYGFVAGVVFWWTSIFWLTEVTWGGWMLLASYCALYIALFTAAVSGLFRQWAPEPLLNRFAWMVLVAMTWAGLEFIRSVLFTGFAWNPLAGSQYQKIAIIQLAAWTGVYGVSALIVFVNMALFLTIERYVRHAGRRQPWHPELFGGLLALALTVWGGTRAMRAVSQHEETIPLRAAVIQPNIPQYEKWTREFVEKIYEQLGTLTHMALRAGEPDLVIWPETADPDYTRDSQRSYELVRELTAMGAPLLVGTMDIEWVDRGVPRYYNSSLLFDRAGSLVDSYDKKHLVMFGEYVPLERFLPFMKAMTPIEASFDAGTRTTVFTLPESDIRFSVLICFEDTVAHLARRAVREGARLLINQTNDAWFRESPASWQHMTHSVFRAVENRVPVIRAANTGVSCGIDRFGRVHDVLSDETGNTFVAGFKIISSAAPMETMPLTFYAKHGDVFGWTGAAWVAMLFVTLWRGYRTNRKGGMESP